MTHTPRRADRPGLLRPGAPSLAALALGLAACSSDDGGGAPTFAPEGVTTYVTYTRDNGNTSLLRGDAAFNSGFQVILSGNWGTSLDWFGNAYQAEETSELVGVRVLRTVRARSFDGLGALPVPTLDRTIEGAATTLMQPRSATVLHRPGLLVVTDVGDGALKVWSTEASGDAAPIATIPTGAAPWDTAYDEAADRLFATLDDGRIAVFDGFAANVTAPPTATRFLTPSTDGATATAARLTGIALTDGGERIVVCDPGAENAGQDGRVLAVDGGAAGSGAVPLAWVEASLGHAEPVGVTVDLDGVVRVADLERDRVVAFRIGDLGQSPLPRVAQGVQNPADVTLEPAVVVRQVASPGDLDDPTRALDGLVVAAGADGAPATITLIDEDLAGAAPSRTFAYDRDVSALALDALGNLFVSTPDGPVSVVHRFTTQRGTGTNDAFDLAFDRDIGVPADPGGLFDPPTPPAPIASEGFDVDASTDLLVVADGQGQGLYVFGRSAGSEAEELRFLGDGFVADTSEPIAVDYDPASDRLFVGVSNGVVYVYDAFVGAPGDAPDRFIVPSNALGTTQVSTSLAALVYDATNDVLLLADVGAASGAGADGAVYVIRDASAQNSLTPPDVTLDGATALLDDPVSLAWNGRDLWVADRGRGEVTRFDDVLALTGNTAPSATLAVPAVSAIALVPADLAPETGGSLLPLE
ncbi:MAG: hypothetical protein AAFU73_10240 [Planctomycetota bacterium]